jgi:hypothetical protein
VCRHASRKNHSQSRSHTCFDTYTHPSPHSLLTHAYTHNNPHSFSLTHTHTRLPAFFCTLILARRKSTNESISKISSAAGSVQSTTYFWALPFCSCVCLVCACVCMCERECVWVGCWCGECVGGWCIYYIDDDWSKLHIFSVLTPNMRPHTLHGLPSIWISWTQTL